uniref:Uncharacterized protein n=1 Tax=Rhizophora mucronata TaxID=61149 RepID=A0A2P2NLQ1_RHIMU
MLSSNRLPTDTCLTYAYWRGYLLLVWILAHMSTLMMSYLISHTLVGQFTFHLHVVCLNSYPYSNVDKFSSES